MQFSDIKLAKDEVGVDVYSCKVTYYDYTFSYEFSVQEFDSNGTLDLAKAEAHISTFIVKAYENYLKSKKPTVDELQARIEQLEQLLI